MSSGSPMRFKGGTLRSSGIHASVRSLHTLKEGVGRSLTVYVHPTLA